jgi:hypothetical protein
MMEASSPPVNSAKLEASMRLGVTACNQSRMSTAGIVVGAFLGAKVNTPVKLAQRIVFVATGVIVHAEIYMVPFAT